jgi:hypothetical protein
MLWLLALLAVLCRMKIGRSSGVKMSLITRLDGRSKGNESFTIKDSEGKEIATVKLLGESSSALEVTTKEGLVISKPNGWQSPKP